jgi:hypothetical protein
MSPSTVIKPAVYHSRRFRDKPTDRDEHVGEPIRPTEAADPARTGAAYTAVT